MEIKIDPKKKTIKINYDVSKDSKKLFAQLESLVKSLPGYLVEVLPSLKSKKDKGSQP